MDHHQTEEVADIRKTYQWMEKAGLKDSTEALIMAAEEQVLNTRSIEARVYQGLKEELEKMWSVTAAVVPTVIRVL